MRLRELRKQIRLLEAFLRAHQERAELAQLVSSMLVPSYGAKIGRQAVYKALGEASGRTVSNAFVAECDAILSQLGGKKGNSHGYRSWRHLAWRETP